MENVLLLYPSGSDEVIIGDGGDYDYDQQQHYNQTMDGPAYQHQYYANQ